MQAFADAFAFRSKNRLKFDPDDKIMDIYHTVYPPGSAVDSMELESFALTLEHKYGINFATLENPNLTLGELFEMTRNPNNGVHDSLASSAS